MPSTIFVIDSSPAVRRMVEQISTPAGYDVVGFHDGPAALEAARRMSPALIITDYHLDNMTFSGFCKEVHKLDNLSDTYIIALTGATDKFDDSHLKSLGVKAFLKKPFQSEHLLDLIKDLDRSSTPKNGGKKKRSWPPTSSATDSDDDLDDLTDDAKGQDDEVAAEIPYSLPPKAPEKEPSVAVQAAAPASSHPAAAEPEEAMKGLFGQLLQSMSGRTEQKIAQMLPQMVSAKLETHVTRAVEAEVHLQLGATLSQERLTEIIEPLLMKALPKVLSAEMSVLEPIIRHTIFEIASPLIKDQVEQMMRDEAESVKQSFPEVVREHLRSMGDELREQLKQAASEQAERLAGEVIRAVAEAQIQTTVQQVIPSMVEEQIKAEIRRLTQAA
ncbi:MAG TPA: response regulator [Nitrospira sp.]|nr:response regulator [Nitrospira sp.]